MKLYYSPAACSLSPHIVLRETGLPFELVQVNIPQQQTADGADYRAINPKGQVPALQRDDGELITEGPVIVQYLAERAPEKKLLAPAGSLERYRTQEWLNFICSELHKNFGLIFKYQSVAGLKDVLAEAIVQRLGLVEKHLQGREYLVGSDFTVADAYLFTVLSWCKFIGVELGGLPAVSAFNQRVGARPAVREALRAEGLLTE